MRPRARHRGRGQVPNGRATPSSMRRSRRMAFRPLVRRPSTRRPSVRRPSVGPTPRPIRGPSWRRIVLAATAIRRSGSSTLRIRPAMTTGRLGRLGRPRMPRTLGRCGGCRLGAVGRVPGSRPPGHPAPAHPGVAKNRFLRHRGSTAKGRPPSPVRPAARDWRRGFPSAVPEQGSAERAKRRQSRSKGSRR